LVQILEQNKGAHLIINLTGSKYQFEQSVDVKSNVILTSKQSTPIQIIAAKNAFLFQIMSGSSLALSKLSFDLSNMHTNSFISLDSSGSVQHVSFSMKESKVINYKGIFFDAPKVSVADSIIIDKNQFLLSAGILFKMDQEQGKKGYYNVERLSITNNQFKDYQGQILDLIRTGNDESTMGPIVIIANNQFMNITSTSSEKQMIHFAGIQKTLLANNRFNNCYTSKVMILYQDEVKAAHRINNNTAKNSGKIQTNKFLVIE
jgi:poly(beta-D-mannuronate) lyase